MMVAVAGGEGPGERLGGSGSLSWKSGGTGWRAEPEGVEAGSGWRGWEEVKARRWVLEEIEVAERGVSRE